MISPSPIPESRLRFETSAGTHVGLAREENQDDLLVKPEAGLWAVADGVGGLHDGRLASRTLVEALAAVPPGRDLRGIVAAVRGQAGIANRSLLDIAHRRSIALGTTLVALAARDEGFACLWAGDSRLYQIRGRQIRRISEDHSEAGELVRQGVLTHEEARDWPRRNVITRALGVEEPLDLELAQGRIEDGDIFILCSDGLTAHLDDSEILAVVAGRPLDGAADALIEATLRRGASDNVTVIVVGARRENRHREVAGMREKTVYIIPRAVPRE
ncbi:MAG: protein phosphatase 2C domain-containing protein [Hyphomicrobiales bacterium]|uniref:PP2C family protein-serine/threonine phosphatase n=1 Tax=Rhabdaerophilum calidifontis TaxID=2604328 RepID=UPI00123A4A6B|nr:protein phosphatase 2C domain-containing protein [Rhabdaerophilum calidifontis]MCA1953429.1 protein phosphatase 2C domain-containing protein [Hyphomicrobiales bacterium]